MHKTYRITQKDFKKQYNGITLLNPGRYEFAEDITFKSDRDNMAAITIRSCNVTLSLKSHTLRHVGSGRNNYGIVVYRDVNDVKITGDKGIATIIDFTSANIRAFGRINNITIKNIISTQSCPRQLTNSVIPKSMKKIENLQMNGGIIIGEGDFYATYMQNTNSKNIVKNITLKNLKISNAIIGCQIVSANKISVSGCKVTRNSFYGMLMGNVLPSNVFPIVKNICVENSVFSANRSVVDDRLSNPVNTYLFETLSVVAYNNAKNVRTANSFIENNEATFTINGASHINSENILWERCRFIGNCGKNIHMSKCCGVKFRGVSRNIKIIDCRISETSGAYACGFEVIGAKLVIARNLIVRETNGRKSSKCMTISSSERK